MKGSVSEVKLMQIKIFMYNDLKLLINNYSPKRSARDGYISLAYTQPVNSVFRAL